MKVSIIIPVYNTEKYISRCIESCLAQTLTEIEIILIDDCSTDSSRDIIISYAEKYPDKIRYIFQPTNQRQGAARNRGMEVANGDYLLFVDSDDWIEPDACKSLYNKAVETDSDMIGSDGYYCSWDDHDKQIKLNIDRVMCGVMNKEKKEQYVKNYGFFWTRLYKRRFLEEYELKFPERIFYEDAFFNFYSVLYANRIEHIEGCFYHYYQGNQSTVRNRNNPHQYERIKVAEYILQYGLSNENLSQYRDVIGYKYLYMQGGNLVYICLGLFDNPDKEKMCLIADNILKNNQLLHKDNIYARLPNEFRVFFVLNKISPSLCIFVYRYRFWYKWEAIKRRLKINECSKNNKSIET